MTFDMSDLAEKLRVRDKGLLEEYGGSCESCMLASGCILIHLCQWHFQPTGKGSNDSLPLAS